MIICIKPFTEWVAIKLLAVSLLALVGTKVGPMTQPRSAHGSPSVLSSEQNFPSTFPWILDESHETVDAMTQVRSPD